MRQLQVEPTTYTLAEQFYTVRLSMAMEDFEDMASSVLAAMFENRMKPIVAYRFFLATLNMYDTDIANAEDKFEQERP